MNRLEWVGDSPPQLWSSRDQNCKDTATKAKKEIKWSENVVWNTKITLVRQNKHALKARIREIWSKGSPV